MALGLWVTWCLGFFRGRVVKSALVQNGPKHPFLEKLLGSPEQLLTRSSLTSQPIKCHYLCKCDITW